MGPSSLSLLSALAITSGSLPDAGAAAATVQSYFALRTRRDQAGITAITIPTGKLTRIRFNEAGIPEFRYATWADLIPGIGRNPAILREVMHDTSVSVVGPLATVSGSFSVWIDARFAYCGANTFELVNQNGRWLIVNVTWTERTTECPGAASRPPAE